MRIACPSIVITFLVAIPCSAQEPPAPLPVLPAKVDTSALRAAMRIPFDPPTLTFHFPSDGWYDFGNRSAEAPARISEITSQRRGDASDAERFDELAHWYLLLDDDEYRDCASRAAKYYRQRLQSRPNDATLLARLGNVLCLADEHSEAREQLERAVTVDPECWRAWLTLAKMDLVAAANAWDEDSKPSNSRVDLASMTLPRPKGNLVLGELLLQGESSVQAADTNDSAADLESRNARRKASLNHLNAARRHLDSAFARAPRDMAVLFTRVTLRDLTAVVNTVDRTAECAAASQFATTAANLMDLQSALAAKPDDVDLIGLVTCFEVQSALSRLNEPDPLNIVKNVRRLLFERVQRLESIASRAHGPTAARASLMAAIFCQLVGQQFRANVHVRFAVSSDPNNPKAWEAYLAALAETGQRSEYLSVARRCAERFDKAVFASRLADALAAAGDNAGALKAIKKLHYLERETTSAWMAEAVLLLKSGNRAEIPRVQYLLDRAESRVREESNTDLQTDCELHRACVQFIGGNASLGRSMLDDLARREPDNPRVKAVLSAVED